MAPALSCTGFLCIPPGFLFSKSGAQVWWQPLQILSNSCMKLGYDCHWMEDIWNLVSLLLLLTCTNMCLRWLSSGNAVHVSLSVADCQSISPFIISCCQGYCWTMTTLIHSRAHIGVTLKVGFALPFSLWRCPKNFPDKVYVWAVYLCLPSTEVYHSRARRHRQQKWTRSLPPTPPTVLVICLVAATKYVKKQHKEEVIWVSQLGDVVHREGMAVGAGSVWSHYICSQKVERD